MSISMLDLRANTQPVSRLLFPLQPLSDESLPGFLARVTDWNHLRRPSVLLETAKVAHAHADDLSSRVAPLLDQFAEALGVTPGELAPLVIRQGSGPRRRDFHGVQIRGSLIEHGRRRVAPAALRSSAHHRAVWMLRPLTYCAETWDTLIERCPGCGAALRWSLAFGIDVCEHCHADLKQATTRKVPYEQRDSLAFVTALASPDEHVRGRAVERLPVELRALQSGDLFELVLAMARVLARADYAAGASDGWERALAAAGRVALSPEWNVSALLQEAPKANAKIPDSVLRLRREAISLGRPGIITAIDLLTLGWDGPRHGPMRLKNSRIRRNELTLTEAAAQLGISRSELRGVIEKGLAVGDERSGPERKHVWLSPSDVQSLKARLSGRLAAVTFSKATHLPVAVIGDLVTAGLLKQNHDPLVEALFGGLQLSRRSAARLVKNLEANLGVVAPGPGWIPLPQLFTTIGGCEKPWVFFIQAALRGRVEGGLRRVHREHLDLRDIWISPAAAGMAAWWRMQPQNPPAETRGRPAKRRSLEVQELLNCYPRDLSWLRSRGLLSRDPNRPAEIDGDLLAAFARDHISTGEIAARTGRTGSDVAETLRLAGISRSEGPFWPRAQVEAILSTKLTSAQVREEQLEQHYRYALRKTADAVRAARVRAGLSQTELGRLASVSQNQLSDVERTKAAPSLALLSRLSMALHRPLTDLVG